MRAGISALTRANIALIPVFQAERCRRRITAVAILKLKVWHPVANRGSTKQEEIPITKNMDSLRRSAFSIFIPRFCFVPSYHSSFRDGKSIR